MNNSFLEGRESLSVKVIVDMPGMPIQHIQKKYSPEKIKSIDSV